MYLGIDIGTSGVKVVLTDNGSNIIGSETSDLKVVRKNIGWSEQEPNDWWKATNEAIFKIKTKPKVIPSTNSINEVNSTSYN